MSRGRIDKGGQTLREAAQAVVDHKQATPDHFRCGLTLADHLAALRAALDAPTPPPGDSERRDKRPDWEAIERLVYDAVKREEISAARGAEILGLRITTWREVAAEIGRKASHE